MPFLFETVHSIHQIHFEVFRKLNIVKKFNEFGDGPVASSFFYKAKCNFETTLKYYKYEILHKHEYIKI